MKRKGSIPQWAHRGRGLWRYRGQQRPPFAVRPGPGQESVWDYPRPPRIEPDAREVVVRVEGFELARTNRSVRVLETASPPTFYLPPQDVAMERLAPAPGVSRCEWKGEARYFDYVFEGKRISRLAWSYPDPFPGFESLAAWVAFYPDRAECRVAGLRAEPQPGAFYGGWVTPEIVGPMKGEPGSEGW